MAHGGWTAAIFDDFLGRGMFVMGHLAVTAVLSVAFRKPVPLFRPLLLTGRIVVRESARWSLSAEMVLESTGALLATATGVWVERTGEHFARQQAWLEHQDSQAVDR